MLRKDETVGFHINYLSYKSFVRMQIVLLRSLFKRVPLAINLADRQYFCTLSNEDK